MLLEPAQLMAFDLSRLADAMIWNRALVTRVSVVEFMKEKYSERLLRDANDAVIGVKRVYEQSERQRSYAFVTPSEAVAQNWATSKSRRAGRGLIHRSCAHRRMAGEVIDGHSYRAGDSAEEERFLSWLVAFWERPDAAIEGISQLDNGVFGLTGSNIAQNDMLVPPVWIGVEGSRERKFLVGPTFQKDSDAVVGKAKVREIRDISPGFRRKGGQFVARRSTYRFVKRLIDIFVSLTLLVLLLPFVLVLCVLLVIDDGFPLLFAHERQQRGGRNFGCLKFRTMGRNAEAMVAEFASEDLADGPQVNIKDDPRVTRLGKHMRKYQLDEIPQLWNVLVGEMSLVGPRPSPDRENQFCPAWREIRLSVRPGITGLWQVERTRTPGEDFQEWIKYDVAYVRNASLWLDAKICLKTVRNLIQRS
jgi:lipopolysaccharide/colanic/teichoic acid biosynthesis glycosyltransferase